MKDITPLIIVFIAAISNAIMDVLQHNYTNSIFRKLNEKFWNPNISYLNKYKDNKKENGRKYNKIYSGITDTFSDSWHIAKLILILCIVISNSNTIKEFVINLIIWGFTFKIFYSYILIKK